jgi:copper(I)-binding protein
MARLLHFLGSASLLVSSAVFAQGLPVAERAWIREAPPGAPMAGYLVLRNETGEPAALVGAGSDAFAGVMIHRTVHQGAMTRMRHEMRVEIPAGGRLAFEPGGLHLMLMEPVRFLSAGDRVPIELEFAGGARQTVTFEVRAEAP